VKRNLHAALTIMLTPLRKHSPFRKKGSHLKLRKRLLRKFLAYHRHL